VRQVAAHPQKFLSPIPESSWMRHHLRKKILLLAGTKKGLLLFAGDEGDSREMLADNLPPVFAMAVAEI